MASAARVSQIVAQVLRTPAPPSFGRVSQIISQTLRRPEAQYNANTSNFGAAIVSKFKGVKNLTIKPLPYNYAASNSIPALQSMFYPTFADGQFEKIGSQIVGGKTTVLTPSAMFQFKNNDSTTGGTTSGVPAPVVFAGWLVGGIDTGSNGKFWVQKKLIGSSVFANIAPSTDPVTVEGTWNGLRSDMVIVAVKPGSRLYLNILAKYLPASAQTSSASIMGVLGALQEVVSKLLNPISIITSIILDAILAILSGAPPSALLVVGCISDYVNGNSNGTIALQCCGILPMYPGLETGVPATSFFAVPFQKFGGDPDLYVGKAGNIICTDLTDIENYNSWQFWNSSGVFGPRTSTIYDFNLDTFQSVSLDDATLDAIFQTQSGLGLALTATTQGWICILPTAFGLNPSSICLLISPDFRTWEILNFIPSDNAGNALLTNAQPLIVNADRNGFYVGTTGHNFQYTGAASNTVPATNKDQQAPFPVSCMDLTCGNANTTGQWANINPSFN